MTHGFLIPLVTDLKIEDGAFSWDFELPGGAITSYSHSPLDFHDSAQVAGTPLFKDDTLVIKFNNFWTIESPPGYSLLVTHPVNRYDLPFVTLTGPDRHPISTRTISSIFRRNGAMPLSAGCSRRARRSRSAFPVEAGALERAIRDHHRRRGGGGCRLRRAAAVTSERGVYRRQFRAPKR